MKTESSINLSENTSSNTFMNTLGLFVLCALLIVQPFHFAVTEILTYYREIFAVIFSIFIIQYFLKYRIRLALRPEVFFMFLFLFTLIFFALFDPGINLYGFDPAEASEKIVNVNLTLYVLRNALLYIPMVCYFALRGLSEKEIKLIAGIVALVAPFSTVAYLYNIEFLPSYNIMNLVNLGGKYLSWNTYSPYLTFPFIASLYLVFSLRNKIFKLIFLAIGLFLLLYVMVSASRQSLSFCVLITFVFFIFATIKNKVSLLLILISICFIFYMIIYYVSNNYIVNDNLLDRFGSVTGYVETERFKVMREGLELLDVTDFVIGAGLSSVIVSGPHNDFIRWTQRIGIPGMVLSFLPFFLSLLYVFRSMQRKKQSPMLLLFISSGIFFTIYHSFFGYPRDDAYQALYAFLGLTLWLAISKSEPVSNEIMPQYLPS